MVKKDSLIGAQKRPLHNLEEFQWHSELVKSDSSRKSPNWFWSINSQLPKVFFHSNLKNWLSISVIHTLAHIRNLVVFIKEKPPILFFTNQLFKFCQTRINRFHENWNRFIFVQCSVFQTSLHQTLASSLWLVFNHS